MDDEGASSDMGKPWPGAPGCHCLWVMSFKTNPPSRQEATIQQKCKLTHVILHIFSYKLSTQDSLNFSGYMRTCQVHLKCQNAILQAYGDTLRQASLFPISKPDTMLSLEALSKTWLLRAKILPWVYDAYSGFCTTPQSWARNARERRRRRREGKNSQRSEGTGCVRISLCSMPSDTVNVRGTRIPTVDSVQEAHQCRPQEASVVSIFPSWRSRDNPEPEKITIT